MTIDKLKYFNLTTFADVINATTSSGSGNDLSPEMKTFYDKKLLQDAEPELIHDQFAVKRPIPKNGGKIIEFRKFSSLQKATTPLTEGTPPDAAAMNVSYITATVAQYGNVVKLTDMLEMTAIDNVILEAEGSLSTNAGKTLDTITREVINAGTNVIYAPIVNGSTVTPVTARTSITSASRLRVEDVKLAALQLKRYNTPKINGSYVAIIHPDVAHDLMNSDEWIDVVKYSAVDKIFNGEIGKLAGIRFIENTEAKIFAAGGASRSGTGKTNVYSTLVFGANAYATTEISGGGLQMIVKQKGSAGTSDPLDQISSIGWKATKVAKILNGNYIVRIESSCENEETAVSNA